MLWHAYRYFFQRISELGDIRTIHNDDFQVKRRVYQQSQYALARSIQSEEWTMDSLTARQEQLAARAVHIWRSDFA